MRRANTRRPEGKGATVHRLRPKAQFKPHPEQRDNVREFMRAMSIELSQLARKNGLHALAVIYDMAREAADAEIRAEAHSQHS